MSQNVRDAIGFRHRGDRHGSIVNTGMSGMYTSKVCSPHGG
jgi:hypothetical protein